MLIIFLGWSNSNHTDLGLCYQSLVLEMPLVLLVIVIAVYRYGHVSGVI